MQLSKKLRVSLSLISMLLVGTVAYFSIGSNKENVPDKIRETPPLKTTDKSPEADIPTSEKKVEDDNVAAISQENVADVDKHTGTEPSVDALAEPEWEDTLGSIDGNRLEWSPEPILESGKVFDLCNDEQAIAAGFDGGDLSGDRQNMGIDCASSANRYGLIASGGELTLSNTSDVKEDIFAADEETNIRPDSTLLLGYQGPSHANVDISSLDVGNVVVLPNTINTIDGTTYGLLANTSDNWAKDVSVQVGGAYYEHPLSLQPGETAPFSIESDTGVDVSSTVKTSADLSEAIDVNRSILVTGAPGNWQGEIENLPAPDGLIDLSQHSGVVRYYQTNLEIAQSNSTEQIPLASIENVEVVVSFFNSEGLVTSVIKPSPMRVDVDGVASHQSSLVAGDMMTIGFIIPEGVVDFGIWVGGST